MYEVLGYDTIKPKILPHLSVAKRGYASKSNLVSVLSTHSLQVESIFPVAPNEEEVKRTSLCFLCSYVRMNVFMLRHEKRTFSLGQMNNVELTRRLSCRENAFLEKREKNVFVKPNEQCRACLNIVMARKRTFRETRKERLIHSLIHLSFY